METKLNYKIKYAVQKLTITGGFTKNYEDITLGFIASICYVINQNISYLPNGIIETKFKVVFPYKNIDDFKCSLSGLTKYEENPTLPKYNIFGECKNKNTVKEIYDTYEEALLAAEEENKNRKKQIIKRTTNYKEELEKYNQDLQICKQFEQLIHEKTKNMQISKENISIKRLIKQK